MNFTPLFVTYLYLSSFLPSTPLRFLSPYFLFTNKFFPLVDLELINLILFVTVSTIAGPGLSFGSLLVIWKKNSVKKILIPSS